jgi:PAS domain S-box-containing protein
MSFEIWVPWKNLVFLDPTGMEVAFLALCGLVAVLLLVSSRREFVEAVRSRRRALLLVGLSLLPLITTRLLAIRLSAVSPPPLPNIPLNPPVPFAALLTAWPILAAGIWLGAGSALLVGGISGLLRAGTVISGIADPLHLALFGFFVVRLLRQRRRGWLEQVARQPLAASVLATPIAVGLLFLSAWARVASSGLAGFDYALQFAQVRTGCALIEALSAGAAAQVLFSVNPSLRPVQEADRLSWFRRSLHRKLLVVVVPLILVATFVLLYAVTTVTLHGARAEAVKDLARDAHSAADEIPTFIHTGQGLLAEFAKDERLSSEDPEELEALLESDLRIGAFFDHLMLFDPDGELASMYPPAPTGNAELTAQEEDLLARVLVNGAPQISSGHESQWDEALLSFFMPTRLRAGDGSRFGALVGRTHLQANPAMERILADLQWASGRGEGFVVDEEGRIVAHPDPGMVLSLWQKDQYRDCIADAGPQGLVCEGRDPVRNTRELLYYLPAEGYPWSVVIHLPYEVVLNQARKVAVPLLVLQGVFGAGLVVAIVLLVGRMTGPLKQLANAAERIAKGGLTKSIDVSGADEVGRLGLTLEDMRMRLQDRMSDLSLLLEVSQAVSSTLDLSTGLSFVLEGALKGTSADVARAVLVGDGNPRERVISRGEAVDGLDEIERALVAEVERRRSPVAFPGLGEAAELVRAEGLAGPIEAAVALPVGTQDHMLAVIWIGYTGAHRLEMSKMSFLSMLTNHVAILVENARLFHAVEGERTRLAAILESVSDVVLVTDQEDRVLLVNSAAEQAFAIQSEAVLGQAIQQTDLAPEVAAVVVGPSSTEGSSQELSLPNGRVLYADVSTIESSQGERLGQVAVMRDITRFKELDDMKSEFLATVSHDLRAPLTFMRGYADRLDAVGRLNEKQELYVENILKGVQRIDDLVLELLDLSRIEAGLGVEREPCHLGVIVAEAVSSLRARATAKGVALQIQPPLDLSDGGGDGLVSGDRALLRQAIVNLLDNAIKYTPPGGRVAAGLSIEARNGRSQATIRVADTGIGIAPDEQVRLFEKFYRTKRGGQSGASGTGLGLAIVKSVVERHEGNVWVESEVDAGSTFYISLPLVRDESLDVEELHQ